MPIKFTDLPFLATDQLSLNAIIPIVQNGENYRIALSSISAAYDIINTSPSLTVLQASLEGPAVLSEITTLLPSITTDDIETTIAVIGQGVGIQYTIPDAELTALTTEQQTALANSVKLVLAEQFGVSVDDVTVTLVSGSIKVLCDIPYVPNTPPKEPVGEIDDPLHYDNTLKADEYLQYVLQRILVNRLVILQNNHLHMTRLILSLLEVKTVSTKLLLCFLILIYHR